MEFECTYCKKTIRIIPLENNEVIIGKIIPNQTTGKIKEILGKKYLTFKCPLCHEYDQKLFEK